MSSPNCPNVRVGSRPPAAGIQQWGGPMSNRGRVLMLAGVAVVAAFAMAWRANPVVDCLRGEPQAARDPAVYAQTAAACAARFMAGAAPTTWDGAGVLGQALTRLAAADAVGAYLVPGYAGMGWPQAGYALNRALWPIAAALRGGAETKVTQQDSLDDGSVAITLQVKLEGGTTAIALRLAPIDGGFKTLEIAARRQ